MIIDLEAQPEWRERLRSLNYVIASSNEPLLGNLFYEHAQADFVDSPPFQRYKVKRERFRAAVRDRLRMLEVGVNGGHSAYLALTENPELEFHGVDICGNLYVERAVGWLKKEFPGRVFFYKGDSSRILPALVTRGLTFDVFHIDGAKHLYYMDIVNSSRMVSPSGAIVIVDDSNYLIARVSLSSLAKFNVITRLPEFPPMSPVVSHDDTNNEVRGLVPSSGRKYVSLKSYSYVLATARGIKALAAGKISGKQAYLGLNGSGPLKPGQGRLMRAALVRAAPPRAWCGQATEVESPGIVGRWVTFIYVRDWRACRGPPRKREESR